MQIAPFSGSSLYSAAGANPYGHASSPSTHAGENRQDDSATILTLSDAALAALAAQTASPEADFAEVVRQARELLNELLDDAGRNSPLEDGKLALDMSRLSQRQLNAIATTEDGLFTSDERDAASLELERRFALALSGPAAVAAVTNDYRVLYRAAANYLDEQSAEQKAAPAWQAARNAVREALDVLETNPKAPPQGIANDPVAEYLAAAENGDGVETAPGSLARNMRASLDKLYAEAQSRGQNPTFDKGNRSGHYIDLSSFDSRALSAMALNQDSLFSAAEVRAANAEIRSRSSAALAAAFQDASRSGDPTAFALNVVSVYASMSPDERQASGLSDTLLNAAVANFETSAKLLSMLSSAGSGDTFGWFSR